MTAGIIMYNMILFILIAAFAMDGVSIGQASNTFTTVNESGVDNPTDISESSFLTRFWVSIWDLPWWFNMFAVVFVNLILLPITVFAWIRGL